MSLSAGSGWGCYFKSSALFDYLICRVSLLVDDTYVVKSLTRSRLSRKSGVDDKSCRSLQKKTVNRIETVINRPALSELMASIFSLIVSS